MVSRTVDVAFFGLTCWRLPATSRAFVELGLTLTCGRKKEKG